ncbi:MAG: type II toxin-antitoxin system VapC family toxin [Pseudomonadota bacterium]
MKMYAETNRVALDSNAMSYLIEALGSFSGPPTGNTAAEKIALARCFLYRQPETVFCITPTVSAEFSKIPDQERLSEHANWALLHLQVLPKPSSTADLIFRTNTLNAFHSDVDDCRIVAECEALDVNMLLTSDRKFCNAMNRVGTTVGVLSGQQYWNEMAVSPGETPMMELHPDSPLNTATWWKVCSDPSW